MLHYFSRGHPICLPLFIAYNKNMVKTKKKRNKPYTGQGAAMARPAVTRISAVNRSRIGQWWFDNKRMARIGLIAAGVIFGIVVLISGIVGIML